MSLLRWDDVSARAGRNDLPYLLAQTYLIEAALHEDDVPRAVADAWVMAEWPEQYLDTDVWLLLFEHAGVIDDDGKEILPPTEITLYRGATEDRALGLSWTTDLARAKWFATRFTGMRDSQNTFVYSLTATQTELLAHFTRRGEDEWVVDTSNLEPEDLTIAAEFSGKERA